MMHVANYDTELTFADGASPAPSTSSPGKTTVSL